METVVDYPESFRCPITQELMKDPVIDLDGNSFERAAIEDWLKRHATSPITRNPMTQKDLTPNRALKDSIDAFLLTLVKPVVEEEKVKERSPLSLQIATNSAGIALVSVVSPEGIQRTPANVVCIIDVSGSMAADATLKDENGQLESFGLSVLDVVKHAVKTIIHTLDTKDRLALVCYSTQARVVLTLRAMDETGKNQARVALETLHPDGTTNLWDGLQKGLDLLRGGGTQGNTCVILLTDGQPNIVPPRGHIPMFRKYITSHNISCTLHTFGFGYQLDSGLLADLASEGHGIYSFIPDSSLVGTTFVNLISGILCSSATEARLSLEPINGASFDNSRGLTTYPRVQTSNPNLITLHIGPVLCGQSKDVVVALTLPQLEGPSGPYLRAKLEFNNALTGNRENLELEGGGDGGGDGGVERETGILVHHLRLFMVDQIKRASTKYRSNPEAAKEILSKLIDFLSESKGHNLAEISARQHPLILDIVRDLEGQVAEALAQEANFNKWGKHYLPSLLGAHLCQICNNFKDPGVQNYGQGRLFQEIRDTVDDLFNTLPPPKPSVKPVPVQANNARHVPVYHHAVPTMDTYNCRGSG
eukprot:TRINITY_DN717_c0_g1_i1.p1 TRINITY_DN717_c0_g1~~TRINITY_DN717_c0_g1_i1.p1  ORF type:complete len:624 (-),score=111.90 TRINITY_DN717_c0_g1_i1:373-2145(-)